MTARSRVGSRAQSTDVIECFLSSDRVCEDDIPLALGFLDCWSQHVVLRQWVTVMRAKYNGDYVGLLHSYQQYVYTSTDPR